MSQTSCVVYGGQMMLFASSGATAVMPMAFSTKADLKIDLSTRKTSSKDSGNWDENTPAKFSWSVSSDQLYNYGTTGTTNNFNKLWGYFNNRCIVNVAFASAAGSAPNWTSCTTNKFSGCGIITALSINSQDGADVTYTANIVGTGALSFA